MENRAQRLGQISTFNASKTINANYGINRLNICNVKIKLNDVINTNNTVHGLTYTIYDLALVIAQTVLILT